MPTSYSIVAAFMKVVQIHWPVLALGCAQAEMFSMLLEASRAANPKFKVDIMYCRDLPGEGRPYRRLLGYAAAEGHVEVVRRLLHEKEVYVNARDSEVGPLAGFRVHESMSASWSHPLCMLPRGRARRRSGWPPRRTMPRPSGRCCRREPTRPPAPQTAIRH